MTRLHYIGSSEHIFFYAFTGRGEIKCAICGGCASANFKNFRSY